MDQFKAQLLTKEAFILAVLVVIGTFFVRLIVETAVPSAKGVDSPKGTTYKTKFGLWWGSVILYAIPVLFGAGIAMLGVWVPSIWPAGVATFGGAVIWGIVVGWFSSFLYKVARKVLKKETGIDPLPGPVDPTKPSTEDAGVETEPEAEKLVAAAPEAKDAPAKAEESSVVDKPAE